MRKISDINYQITPTSHFRSERDELIQKFTDRLNLSRQKDGFKKLSARAVAVKLSHIPTGDLYAFYRQCESAKHFGKYFWWALRPGDK